MYSFADAVKEGLSQGGFRVETIMVTLTYAQTWLYEPRQVSEYANRVSKWLGRRGIPHAYAWVIEMQKRGTPHYHLLLWLPHGTRVPMPDTVAPGSRTRMWPWGMSRVEPARSPGYICKYASKFNEDVPLPPRCRLFGVGGTERRWRRVALWSALPKWLRDRSNTGDLVRRVPHCGWLNYSTGELYPAVWKLTLVSKHRMRFERILDDHPP